MMHILLNLPESRDIEPEELGRISEAIPRLLRRRFLILAPQRRLVCGLGFLLAIGAAAGVQSVAVDWGSPSGASIALLFGPALAIAGLTLILSRMWHARRYLRSIRELLASKACLGCGYPLAGIEASAQGTRCPECGVMDRRGVVKEVCGVADFDVTSDLG